MADDLETTVEAVLLEPFIHQVGGTSSMFCLDGLTICKPLIPQEQKFYETMPEELKAFVPEYRGITSITLREEEGYLTLTARPPKAYRWHCTKLSADGSMPDVREKNGTRKPQHRIRVQSSGGFVIENCAATEEAVFTEGTRTDATYRSHHNPWVLHCHQQRLTKLGILSPSSACTSTQSVILLENLTCKYRFPCILDLKLGVRQHGDDASPAKRISHEAKVAATTSAAIGARMCGMQVYRPDYGYYVCHNKYHGRSLTADGFRETLFQFLCNGTQPRIDVIPVLIDKLQQLCDILSELDSYRFFSSSLLIIYEGADATSTTSNGSLPDGSDGEVDAVHGSVCQPEDHNESPHASIHLIDFAHTTHREIGAVHVGPDEGCLFGLKNIIALLKSFALENS